MHRATAIAAVETIDRNQQALAAPLLLRCHRHEQMVLQQGFGLELLQQHPRLLQGLVGAKQALSQGQGRRQQGGGVVAGQRQLHRGGIAVEAGAIERAAAHKDGDGAGPLALLAQFFSGAHQIGGDRLPEFGQGLHRRAEAPAHTGLLLGRRQAHQGQAGPAEQLLLQPQAHHTALAAQLAAGHVAQSTGMGHPPQAAPAR